MSFDGHIHERQAKRIAKVGSVAALALTPFVLFDPGWWQLLLGWVCGLWMGWWVTPDLDHKAMTREEYRASKTVVGTLWLAYTTMTLYAFVFPHRSILSHSVIGSAIRMFWLLALPVFLLHLVLSKIGHGIPWSWGYVTFAIAWMLQDMVHYIQDGLGPLGLKRTWMPKL